MPVQILFDIWHGFGAETKGALIIAIATILVGLIGGAGIIWQVGSQGKQTRVSITESERRKIKTATYKESIPVCDALSDAISTFNSRLLTARLEIRAAAAANEENLNYSLPSARMPLIMEAHNSFQKAVVNLIYFIERSRFIDPRIIVFQTALNACWRKVFNIYHYEYFNLAMRAMPAENPNGGLLPYTPPSVMIADQLIEISKRLAEPIVDVSAYLADFLVEMQNHLLSDVFGHIVQHRQPTDPQSKVITLDNHEHLETFFSKSD